MRWRIENEGFNSQKNHGYHLRHRYSQKYQGTKNRYYQIGHMISQVMEAGRKSIKFRFYKDETSGRPGSELKEENKAKCDELRALKPYALYTAEDGTTQKFPFLEE